MISTKGRYALRVMLDLAEQPENTYIPLKEIAARQEISEKYLEIVLKNLVKAKLLQGLRGKGGGYQLTRTPEEYPVGEILEIAEGPLSSVNCLLPDTESCPRKEFCQTFPMWEKFDQMVHDFFYGISVADLLSTGEISTSPQN